MTEWLTISEAARVIGATHESVRRACCKPEFRPYIDYQLKDNRYRKMIQRERLTELKKIVQKVKKEYKNNNDVFNRQ